MKQTITFLIISLMSILSSGQTLTYQWANSLNHDGECIEKDPNNDLIVFCPITASTPYLGYSIRKINQAGTQLWVRDINNAMGIEMKLDASGNIYVTGAVNSGTIDIDPGPGTNTITTGQFFAKYDNNGNFIWSVKLATNASNAKRYCQLDVDPAGNVYIASDITIGSVDIDPGPGSVIYTPASSTTGFIAKYNTNGNYVWSHAPGGSLGAASNLIAKNNITGDVYLSTHILGSSGSVDIDPGPAVVNAFSDQDIIIKYDNNGNYLAHRSMPITARSLEESFVDNAGNLVAAGNYGSGATNFGASYVFPTVTGSTHGLFMVKLDPSNSFNTIFANQFGTFGDNLSVGDVTGDVSDNIYTTAKILMCSGTSSNVINISNTSGTTLLDQYFIGTTGCMFPVIEGIALINSDIFIVSTNDQGKKLDYDITAGVNTLPSGTNYGAIAKYSFCISAPSSAGSINGLNNLCTGITSVNYSVSPVSGATSYTWSLPGGWTGSSSNNTISATPGPSGGTISVTASNACGSSSASILSVTVNPNPTANAGPSQTITCSSSTVMLSGSGVSTYTWTGTGIVSGSNTANPVVNMAGTYSLVGSTSGCNSNTATVIVSSNTIAPTVSASSANSVICGPPFQGTTTITASGASTYTWNTSATTVSISVSPGITTQYTVAGTAANGCTNTAVFTQSVSACTGVSTTLNDRSELVVFPNPTNGSLTVKVPSALEGSIEVYNVIGERIYKTDIKEEQLTIDLSQHANGIYFIRIDSVTKKIIKN